MARNLRVEFPGAIYHVTVRMIGDWQADRSQLFRDDADRQRFLERMAERVKQFHVRLYLVCETPAGNLEAKTMADRSIIRRIKKAEEQLDKAHVAAIVKS